MRAKLFFIAILLFSIAPARSFSQTTPVLISIKGNGIYYNEAIIGYYKTEIIDSELTSIVIYNKVHARVAEATYAKGDENWTIATPVDQNKMYLKWSKEQTLELFFKFLVEKKYL